MTIQTHRGGMNDNMNNRDLTDRMDMYLDTPEILTEQTDLKGLLKQVYNLKLKNGNNPSYIMWLNGIEGLILSGYLTGDDREMLKDLLGRKR